MQETRQKASGDFHQAFGVGMGLLSCHELTEEDDLSTTGCFLSQGAHGLRGRRLQSYETTQMTVKIKSTTV